ncbi:retropepsin-like aspartic protease family protein [Algicella marina]|uniref:TIGR02281 family clan AA aspartic protease n=1 Tax=Algicella marina TaxID=2683284 RepID=A0A6P1SW67_9RHOB|nr:TIGR02281 family clan AA aspartic protease [Algicella marina]QHQ34914.1 TIGR02281 family clan AA aspartic protease [Algicella marina]
MDADQNMQLVYLVLLGVFVGSYFFFDAGARLGQNVKMAFVWFGIFGIVIIGFKLFEDASIREATLRETPRVSSFVDREIELDRARDGHFYVTLDINGAPVRFVVDTGASLVVLNEDDARKTGLEPETLRYTGRARTANGQVSIAPITLKEVTLGGVTDTRVRAAVNGGRLDTSLLGMSYLNLFSKIEIAGNRMTLVR